MLPVVFVHGVRTGSHIWEPQMGALQAAGHPVTAVELPGHGSRRGESFSLAAAIETIDQAVKAQPEPPLLVGLSLGGYSSMAYSARHPNSIRALLVAGCSTEIKGKPLRLYRSISTKVASWLGHGDSWKVVNEMLGSLHGHSSLADLKRIDKPIWFINGARDFLRIGERSYLHAAPRSILHVVPRAGHDVNSHAPEVFNKYLLAALAKLPPAQPAL